MLEHASLLLRPWMPASQGTAPWHDMLEGGWFRLVHDAVTDQSLGCILWPHGPGPRWRRGLARQQIRVLETEDGALVFSLRRPWGLFRVWHVTDAEERRLGGIYAGTLLDVAGQRLARLHGPRGTDDNAWRLLEHRTSNPGPHADAELASWQEISGQGTVFRFGDAAHNPFLRMLSLAGALVMLPWPPS